LISLSKDKTQVEVLRIMFVINRQDVGGSSIKYASWFLFVSRGVWDDINKDDKMEYL